MSRGDADCGRLLASTYTAEEYIHARDRSQAVCREVVVLRAVALKL